MTEYRFEAERSAWIKSKHWPDRYTAQRRAEVLARKARKLERGKAGLGDTAFSETETKGTLHRWTSHDDAKTSALGFMAYAVVFWIVVPVFFGVAWLVAKLSYKCWEAYANRYPIKLWPYAVAAAAAASLFHIGRPLGWDLWLIHLLADFIEAATGGGIAPEVLSRWYAAGWVSWMQLNVVLGLLLGGCHAYSWGWAAPAVRRREREAQQARTAEANIQRAAAAEIDTDESGEETNGPEQPAEKPAKKTAKPANKDVTRIL